MRIYDQVSLRDHVKSDRFQRRDYSADSVIERSILFVPRAQLKQFFRSIQQGKRQHQLSITVSKSSADFLELAIYKCFDRLYFCFRSRTPY